MENKIKNSEDFLQSIFGKKTGFSVPKNYFESVEENCITFLSETKFSKENPFKTPENYFNTLENSILHKLQTPKKENKVISLKHRLLKIVPLVAVASVLLLLGLFYFTDLNTNNVSFDTIAQTDIENWIIDNANNLSNDDFATIINNEIINENDFAYTNIKDDTIENYIIDTNNITILNTIN
ncbi:MAG: hypothetical protein ACWIPJ_02940 [Polaribacter sp.]